MSGNRKCRKHGHQYATTGSWFFNSSARFRYGVMALSSREIGGSPKREEAMVFLREEEGGGADFYIRRGSIYCARTRV